MLKACEENAHWSELTFLYLHYDEFDNACLSMMAHPIEAYEHVKFKDTLAKATNTEIFYKAIDFYLQQQPLMLNDLLAVIAQRVDHVRVISQLRKAQHIPLVKQYLLSTQPMNIKEVNDALYELYVLEEDHESELRKVHRLPAARARWHGYFGPGTASSANMVQHALKIQMLHAWLVFIECFKDAKAYRRS